VETYCPNCESEPGGLAVPLVCTDCRAEVRPVELDARTSRVLNFALRGTMTAGSLAEVLAEVDDDCPVILAVHGQDGRLGMLAPVVTGQTLSRAVGLEESALIVCGVIPSPELMGIDPTES